MFISSTFAEVTETFLLVRKGTRGISYNIHMYGILRLFCICEVMFTALSCFEEVLDLRNCMNKSHYKILTEPRLQCVVKSGRKYQILCREQQMEN